MDTVACGQTHITKLISVFYLFFLFKNALRYMEGFSFDVPITQLYLILGRIMKVKVVVLAIMYKLTN